VSLRSFPVIREVQRSGASAASDSGCPKCSRHRHSARRALVHQVRQQRARALSVVAVGPLSSSVDLECARASAAALRENEPPFFWTISERPPAPNFKKPSRPRVCCLILSRGERAHSEPNAPKGPKAALGSAGTQYLPQDQQPEPVPAPPLDTTAASSRRLSHDPCVTIIVP
jgi:hypothetical protein